MQETSNARRTRRRLAHLLAPLALAGAIAISGTSVAQAATSSHAPAAVSSPAQTSSSPAQAASNGPAYFPDAKTAPSGPAWYPPSHDKCEKVFGWSSVLFRTGGSIFYSSKRCHVLSIEFVAKTGWYQGWAKSWFTHWKWEPCGKKMFLWKHHGFALLCKFVPRGSLLRVVNLQNKFVPIKVNV